VIKHPYGTYPVVWSIAGSDNSARAGAQADLLSFQDLDACGRTVLTSLSAQGDGKVLAVYPVAVEALAQQLEALSLECAPKAIKLGLLGNAELIQLLCTYLAKIDAPIVYDPVTRSGLGDPLMQDTKALSAIWDLLPLCEVLTPNIEEAQWLSSHRIESPADMVEAAKTLCAHGVGSVLIKGGHANFEPGYCWDYWSDGDNSFWMRMLRRPGNYRGTGCSLSAALAAALVNGWSTAKNKEQLMYDALVIACAYVQQGIRRAEARKQDAVIHGDLSWHLDDLPEVRMNYTTSCTYSIPEWSDPSPGLYPIVSDSLWVTQLLNAGVHTVQLRIKDESLDGDSLSAQVADACTHARNQNGRLVVNDYWSLAVKHRSYGVHLGQSDLDDADLGFIAMHGLRVGISTHGWWEIARALALKPSYIAFGPVFATDSKIMPFTPLGLDRLLFWSKLTRGACPRIAIGGISPKNTHAVAGTGVEGVAVMSAIVGSDDWQSAVACLNIELTV
jgi:hydroxymethylpyrimidine kinase/phosphomethylpyrimidine kinase/thiamine-phosphate diphosphorylase